MAGLIMWLYKAIPIYAHLANYFWMPDQSNLRQSPLYVRRKVTHHESDVWRRCVSLPLEKDLGYSTGLNSTEVRVLSIDFPGQHVMLLEHCNDRPPNLAIMQLRSVDWQDNREAGKSDIRAKPRCKLTVQTLHIATQM